MNNDQLAKDINIKTIENTINDLAEINIDRFNANIHHITSAALATTPTTTTAPNNNTRIVSVRNKDGRISSGNVMFEVTTVATDDNGKAGGANSEYCVDGLTGEENITISDEQFEEMSKVCRFCLAKRDDMRPIFEHGSCIADVIMMISNIQVQNDDGFPLQICLQCILYASRAFAFKQQVEAADESLKNFISGGFNGASLQPIEIHDEFIFQSISASKIGDDSTDMADFAHVEELDEPGHTIHVGDDEEVIIVDFENVDETTTSENGIKTIASTADDGSIIINDPNQLDNELLNANLYCDNSSDDHLMDLPSDSESLGSRISIKSGENNKLKSKNKCESKKKSKRIGFRNATVTKYNAADEDDDKGVSEGNSDDNDNIVCDESGPDNICQICQKGFKTQEKLIRHAKANHNRRTKRKTTQDIEDAEALSNDAKILPEDKTVYPYQCTVCKQGFNIENDLKIHYSLHVNNNGKHICLHCKKECTTYLQLKRHIRTHYEDKPYKCRVCRKGFPEMGSLTRHFRRHTGEQREKKHLCNQCGKGYYDSHALIIHSRTHTGERPWVCNECGKSFIDSRLLNSHLKVHSGKKPYTCDICNKAFTHHSTLTTHLRTHTGEKPYVCSVCGKTFIQSSNLSLHMRVHSGEKPYKCIICERRFASSSTLAMHMRIHTGEKPYSCKTCGKKFARQDLSAHMRTHTGEKPYVCVQCGKKFATTGQLNQHVPTHTGIKRYVCTICHKRCSSAAYVRKHMKSHTLAQQNMLKGKMELKTANIVSGDTVISIKYRKMKMSGSQQPDDNDVDSDIENSDCKGSIKSDDDDDEKVSSLNAEILHLNSSDLLNVVHGSSNVAIQVPVLTPSDLDTVYSSSSLDGKYIYRSIDPSVIQIKRESGNDLDGENSTEIS